MKIGIYLKNANPETGGGYTFENTVLNIINDNQHKLRHQFIIISECDSRRGLDNLEFIYLDRKEVKFTFLDKVKLVIKRVLNQSAGNNHAGNHSIRDLERKRIDDFLVSREVDFLIYLKQGDFLTFDIPYLCIVWDLEHRLQPYFPEVSNDRAWQKRENTLALLIKRSAFVMTGTHLGKRQIETFYQVPAGKIIVNPMPVPETENITDESEFRRILEKYNINNQYLIYPAQYWPHKNHVTLLKALKYLKDKYRLLLDLVCTGQDKGNKKYIENYMKNLGLEDQVKILGFISYGELVILYKQAFALSFPSLFGPDNLPPLEAFSHGCPVIASRIEGVDEQLGNAAIYFDPMSHIELAENIMKLHNDSEFRNALIKKGFIQIQKLTSTGYLDTLIACLDKFESIRNCWSNYPREQR